MECPHCGAPALDGARFCAQCGTALQRKCTSCGHEAAAADRFCSTCGTRLAPSRREPTAPSPVGAATAPAARLPAAAERRQITVLFCDMVGSSALSTRLDPEQQREVIGAFQARCAAEIKRFEGFVAQYLGDGILAYFGYPAAHEDDAERAVRAGLAVIDTVRQSSPSEGVQLETRVGVATGLVVVGDLTREGITQQNAAVGEATNLAARLQAIAEPNALLVAPATHRLLGALFDYRDLGPHSLKGFGDRVHVHQVVKASAVENRFEAHRPVQASPLLGRGEELDLLLRRWQQAKSGEGRFVLISGEAGIGKSRLTRALQERLRSEAHILLDCNCSPYHQDSALYATINRLLRSAEIERTDDADTKLGKLERILLPAPAEDVALIAALLSIPGGARYPLPVLTPQRLRERTVAALQAHLTRLSEQQPVLVLFEDLHWADPTTLELLALTIGQVRSQRVLLVATARADFTPPWPSHRHTSVVNLTRLDKSEAEAIVRGVTGGRAMPPEVLEQIVSRADGVPLFIEELTKTVVESDLLREAQGGYELVGPLPHLAIPATLHASLLARLDRLPGAKEVAQIAAAIGREFSYELLAAVAGAALKDLEAGLAQLVKAELIFQRGLEPTSTYHFKHALVQDAAYDTLLISRRQELHGQIARVIEEGSRDSADPAILAQHYAEANRPDKASFHWLAAGRASLGKFALTEAMRQLRLGLKQIDRLPDGASRNKAELDTHLCLGNVLIQARGLASPEADRSFQRAYELRRTLGRSRELVPILFGILVVKLVGGYPRAALEIAEELLASTEGDRQSELIANTMLLDVHFWLGNLQKAEQLLSKCLELYDEHLDIALTKAYSFDMKTIALVYASHFYWMLGYPERALSAKRSVDDWVRKVNTPFMHAFTNIWGSAVFHYRGDLDEHVLQVERGFTVAKQVGFPFFVAQANIWSAWNKDQHGALAEEAIPLYESGIGHAQSNGTGAAVQYFRALHAQALSKRGRGAIALELLRDAIEQIDRHGEASHAAEVHRIHATVLAREGPSFQQDAERAFLISLDIARGQHAKSWELRAATSYARWLKAEGRSVEARELLKPLYDWFTEGLETRDLREAKSLLAEL